LPPFVVEGRHEAGASPELEIDWTLCPGDANAEWKRREVRNTMIKEKLQSGFSASYRSSGWSLHPRVWPNDCVTYDPVVSADEVQEDDIVFCQVKPGDRFFAHLVKKKEWWYDRHFFTISNMRGRENGWCNIDQIYGRLVDVDH